MQLNTSHFQKLLIFFTLSLLSCNTSSKAQVLPNGQVYDLAIDINYDTMDGRYYKDMNGNLDPFIGTWKNVTVNKTFTITLWKKESQPFNGIYIDEIVGDYKMVENEGQANENVVFTSRIMVGNTGPWSPGFFMRGNYPAISGLLTDNSFFTAQNRFIYYLSLVFRIDTSNPNTAYWTLKDKKLFKIDGYNNTPLPMDLIMTKQ